MKTIVLCGHTGSMNRGCEAIVRATSFVLNNKGHHNVCVMTFDQSYDKKMGLDKKVDLIRYPKRPFYIKVCNFILRKFYKNYSFGNQVIYKRILDKKDKVEKEDEYTL